MKTIANMAAVGLLLVSSVALCGDDTPAVKPSRPSASELLTRLKAETDYLAAERIVWALARSEIKVGMASEIVPALFALFDKYRRYNPPQIAGLAGPNQAVKAVLVRLGPSAEPFLTAILENPPTYEIRSIRADGAPTTVRDTEALRTAREALREIRKSKRPKGN